VRRIFRQQSLERLSLPRDFDELLELSTPAWWLVLAALLSVVVAGLLWGFLGRVTSTISAPSMVIAPSGRATARARGSSQVTLLLPPDALQGVRPGMRATFSAVSPQAGSPQEIGGSVREVRVVSWNQYWSNNASPNGVGASPVSVGLITLAASSPRFRSGRSSLPAPGVTGSAEIITRERRPISLVVP
jgi:hypothetical protein